MRRHGALQSFKGFPGLRAQRPAGLDPYVYPVAPAASPDDWPVVPFRREWLGTDYPGGNSPEAAIKRLLRFSSSIVSYDSAAPAGRGLHPGGGRQGSRGHGARNARWPACCSTPTTTSSTASSRRRPSGAPDPAIDCRNYIIVYVTDGHDECSSDPCVGGPTGNGPAGDLGEVLLPESVPGARAAANAIDPSVRVKGIPVYVVGLNSDPAFFPALNCIATNSGGKLFAATDRTSLQGALESILDFKRNANFFAAPAGPGLRRRPGRHGPDRRGHPEPSESRTATSRAGRSGAAR